MRRFLLVFLFSLPLFALDGMINVNVDSFDKSDAINKGVQKAKKVDFSSVKQNNKFLKRHQRKIEQLQNELTAVTNLKEKKHKIYNDFVKVKNRYEKLKYKNDAILASIYKKHRNAKREIYLVALHKISKNYKEELYNYLFDNYAVAKYKQNAKIVQNEKGEGYSKFVVENYKELGLVKEEVLKDYIYRDLGYEVSVVKVKQLPFVETDNNDIYKSDVQNVDKFKESGVQIFSFSNAKDLKEKLVDASFDLDIAEKLVKDINKKFQIYKRYKTLQTQNKKIKNNLKKILKEFQNQTNKINLIANEYSQYKNKYETISKKLEQEFEKLQQVANYYDIDLQLDEIEKLVLISPKIYSEEVASNEEVDFVRRKIERFYKNIVIATMAQKERIVNFYDIDVKNISNVLMIKYYTLHFLPFVSKNKLSLLIFATIKVEKKLTKSDFIVKKFKYTDLEFVPVQKGFEKLFVSKDEFSIALAKEFLEENHKKTKYFFDMFCLEDSTLPKEAIDFKHADQNYYNYPAVCFKLDRIDTILKWISKKIAHKVYIPTPDEWSYVASNGGSTKYCWGDEGVDELVEDGKHPENIYLDEEQENTALMPIESFPPSLLGIYDMCGNASEFVKEGDALSIKGNSYISFIEDSAAAPKEYDDSLNTLTTIRLFYKEER